jgi:capsular exopolysaccharide synthesis family protein
MNDIPQPNTDGRQEMSSHYANSPMVQSGSGLSEILGTIRRQKWILIGVICGSLLIGGFVLTLLTPKYTTEAMVLIESQDSSILSLESVVAGLPGDAASVQSEAYILNSRTLAHRVIDRLNLFNDSEFNETLDENSSANVSRISDDIEADPVNNKDTLEYHAITDEFHSRLSVKPQINSRVIAVSFISESPEKARQITNVLLDEYILSRLEAKYESTKQANVWLTQRIADLSEKVEESESEVERSRQQYGLLEGNGATLSSKELSEISAQLIMSRAQRAEAEAELRELKRLVASEQGLSTASELLDSTLIRRFREQQAEIDTNIAELSSEYGPKHPQMLKLAAEEKDIRIKIAEEVNKTIAGLENDVSVARARERSLSRSLESLKNQVAEGNQNSIEVRMLERDAEANRALLTMLMARQKETLSQENFDFQQADARIISYADIPTDPSFPNNIAILALLFLGSTSLGLFIILFIELLDHSVHSGEDLAAVTGVPALGFSPFSAGLEGGGTLSSFAAIRNSAFGQSMKTLSWSIKLGFSDDDPPKIIMITSSVPLEGKSTIATSMAYSQAAAGLKVLLIDADMRCPSIHKKAGIYPGSGLVGFLQGRAGFDDIVVQYKESNLYIVPAGAERNFDSEGLVNSEMMDRLLDLAVENFDSIIIDTPPVMACSDARILSKKADATVFVVRWGSTKQAVAKLALEQLSSAGAHLAGIFLSVVDVERYSTYHYGDSSAYTGGMLHYYAGSIDTEKKPNWQMGKGIKNIIHPNTIGSETHPE